jgi:hypothetical protein
MAHRPQSEIPLENKRALDEPRIVILALVVTIIIIVGTLIVSGSSFQVRSSPPTSYTRISLGVDSCSGNPESCEVRLTFQLFGGGDGDGNSFPVSPNCNLSFGGAQHNGTSTVVMHNSTRVIATCTALSGTMHPGSPISGSIYEKLNVLVAFSFNGTST